MTGGGGSGVLRGQPLQSKLASLRTDAVSASIVIGAAPGGADVRVDMEELLATRLLVQGNSGSGKSHLLRRVLEESARLVQQIVIDPEGDFVTLAEPFGHLVVDGAAYSGSEIARLGARVRTHRASVVLALDGLDVEGQMKCAAQFLGALFDAPRDEWYPALVVVDEAQIFAPAAAGDVSDEARRVSLAAMTNLMCRGRKRGLAGAIVTQRLAKLAKNVAAEASNFLMGRTFLDIDMARAADLLGMERKQAEQIRDLDRGDFLALGPAISRRPIAVTVGPVRTGSRNASHGLLPLPSTTTEDLRALVHKEKAEETKGRVEPEPEPVAADVLVEQIEMAGERPAEVTEEAALLEPKQDTHRLISEVLAELAADEGSTFQPIASLYQDFSVRCRMRRSTGNLLDLATFRRRMALAVAGITDPSGEKWADILRIAKDVADDLLGPFLLLALAAQEGAPCPSDAELARAYGSRSPGRIRRLLEHLERSELIVVRTDYGGRRSIGIPALGLTTAAQADA